MTGYFILRTTHRRPASWTKVSNLPASVGKVSVGKHGTFVPKNRRLYVTDKFIKDNLDDLRRKIDRKLIEVRANTNACPSVDLLQFEKLETEPEPSIESVEFDAQSEINTDAEVSFDIGSNEQPKTKKEDYISRILSSSDDFTKSDLQKMKKRELSDLCEVLSC